MTMTRRPFFGLALAFQLGVLLLIILATATVAAAAAAAKAPTLDASDSAFVEDGWDIAPNAISKVPKDPGHETLTTKAFDSLSTRAQRLLDKELLIDGVRYNDMPANDGSNIDMIRFLIRFLKAQFGKKPEDFQNAVARSHIGCNQFWHAMCPVARVLASRNLTTPDSVAQALASVGGDDTFMVFTNGDVAELVIKQTSDWWRAAVRARVRFLSKAEPKDQSDKFMGHIGHTAQDSFAPAHALRNGEGSDGCGPAVLFQGYTMQTENDMHGATDHDPEGHKQKLLRKAQGSIKRRIQLQACAVAATKRLLEMWTKCKGHLSANTKIDGPERDWPSSCVFATLEKEFRSKVFNLPTDPAVLSAKAGGSVWIYSSLYDQDEKKMQDRLQENPSIAVRVVKIKYGGGSPYIECSNDAGNGECEVEIHEPKYDLDGTNKALPRGVEFTKSMLPNLCDGQLGLEKEIDFDHEKLIRDAKAAVATYKQGTLDPLLSNAKNSDAFRIASAEVDRWRN